MAAPAAFQGDYVDIRFVKTRKVCQIVVEVPIELGTAFVAAFGAPNPATTVPVAIARLDTSRSTERKGGKLAQKAGILCSEGAFIKYLNDTYRVEISNMLREGPADPADLLRALCGVESRADLDHDDKAASIFKDIESSYRAWLTVAA